MPAVGFALVLLAVGFALLPAVGFALLLLFIIFPLLDDESCPGTLVASLLPSRHRLVGCGSFCASSFRVTFLASLQHHYSALRPS